MSQFGVTCYFMKKVSVPSYVIKTKRKLCPAKFMIIMAETDWLIDSGSFNMFSTA
jgi:hypothetical protein